MAKQHPSTRLIHTGQNSASSQEPVAISAAFSYEHAEDLENIFKGRGYGHIYSRISNPSVTAIEQRLAALDSARGSAVFSSGLAAITSIIFSVCESGDELLISKSLFGGTYDLLEETISKAGIKSLYIDPTDVESAKALVSDKTQLVLLESVGNPKMDLADVPSYVKWAKPLGIPVVLDHTILSTLGYSAKDWGIDLVISSTTKYLTGTGTVVGGVVSDLRQEPWSEIRSTSIQESAKQFGQLAVLASIRRHGLHNIGATLSPFSAFLIGLGLETLALRMERHSENAGKLAEFLSKQAEVKSMRYIGHESHPQHALAKTLCSTGVYSGMICCDLGSEDKAKAVIDKLKLAKNAANFGEAKTLVIHPYSTIFVTRSKEDALAAGAGPGVIRISVGLEHIDDIIQDFEQAIKEA